jgi:hypothetical protein
MGSGTAHFSAVMKVTSACNPLRAATFFLIHLEYNKSIEICDTFLTFPPRYKIKSGDHEYVDDITKKVSQQLFEEKTTEESHKFQLIYYIPGELRKMLRHVILYKNYRDPTIFELVALK